ncbi:helix-turn-helix domain-containing protein [Thermophilibacter mediterraneus]|uniref:helix-turn-helix domain-containing protein n=1 Tax=Thermophilibacter mediterraneus TaxID=1871031 RepID=UPI0009F94E02|nr:helix-turn-helix transcriptional regulator [Thermophilibacter mediterraneus]
MVYSNPVHREEVPILIYQRIRAYMERMGFTQSVVAKNAGMTKVAMSESLRGNRRLTADEYVAICNALGVSADFFSQDQEEEEARV